ncbi:hypothetical protein M758_5G195700, partial [Ceratodon purpureus]
LFPTSHCTSRRCATGDTVLLPEAPLNTCSSYLQGRGVAVSSMVTERGTSFHYVEATSVCKGCTAGVLSASGSLQVSPPVKISMSCTCSVSVSLGTCHATFLPPSAPAEV